MRIVTSSGSSPSAPPLEVAPSTYYEFKSRVPSARAMRDAVMMPILLALFQANYSVYGVRGTEAVGCCHTCRARHWS